MDGEEYLKRNFEHLIIIRGEVPFMHEFGDYIGHIEIESKEIKSIKGDYYILCN